MPGSARENDADVIEFVETHHIDRVLDVGAGSGTYGKLLSGMGLVIDAIEVWTPYVNDYHLTSIYSSVTIIDARSLHPWLFSQYDLVIFGDVLEHMSREDSIAVWDAAKDARYRMLSVPIIHYPQGAEFNNPYEVHVQEHMTPEQIREDFGPFVFEKEYEVTGTYIKARVR
jgi:hypothetical protein